MKAAIEAGLHSLGFSSHAPVPLENNFAIRDEKALADYCNEIERLKDAYADRIKIFLGIEADYIPGESYDFDKFRNVYGIEYVIGSVHLVKNVEGKLWFIDGPKRESWKTGLQNGYDGNIQKAVTAYYTQVIAMLKTQKPDVVGHLDKVKMHNHNEFFREDEEWYRALIADVLDQIVKSKCIVEINTRGLYKKRSESLFPGREIIHEMRARNIPVTINTDAHLPGEVCKMQDVAVSSLLMAGYKEVFIFEKGGWTAVPLEDH